MNAVSLFSGIGGFDLAAEWNGIEILCQVEIDERCNNFLKSWWPEIPQYRDIKDFPAEQYKVATIVMGGPPCQPVSIAGKRRGKEDDRWLWKETLAVVEVIKPAWCLFENPPGIIGMGFGGICSELESQGYEVQAFNIPACAVNSPQIRQRIWLLAYSEQRRPEIIRRSEGNRCLSSWETDNFTTKIKKSSQSNLADTKASGWRKEPKKQGECGKRNESSGDNQSGCGPSFSQSNLADTAGGQRSQCKSEREQIFLPNSSGKENQWSNYQWTHCADGKLRRTPDFTEQLADGIFHELLEELAEEGWPHRSVLAALGNSIVPQVAYEILKAIKTVSEQQLKTYA